MANIEFVGPIQEGFHTRAMKLVYDSFIDKFPSKLKLHKGYEHLANWLYEAYNEPKPQVEYIRELIPQNEVQMPSNNKLLVCYSGGLDSTYMLCKLIDAGYDIELMHFKGLNKSVATQECNAVVRVAKLLNLPLNLVDVHVKSGAVKNARPEFVAEHPIKNQMLMAYCVDYMVANGIPRVAFGSGSTDGYILNFSLTDCNKTFDNVMLAFKSYVPNMELVRPNFTETRYLRYKYLLENYRQVLDNVFNCQTPFRFMKMRRQTAIDKYGFVPKDDKCGLSCFKCCFEWLILNDLGVYPDDVKIEARCWDILENSITSDVGHLIKGKTKDERWKILKDYCV